MLKKIEAYLPKNEQEEMDRTLMLDFLRRHDDAYLRTNRLAHMTASAWVTDRTRSRVLMVYHNIYDSWSWCGGHADGERDLLQVALRECREAEQFRSRASFRLRTTAFCFLTNYPNFRETPWRFCANRLKTAQ